MAADDINLLIENRVLLPMGCAVDTLGQLEELAETIRDTARAPIDARSGDSACRLALCRIAKLAEIAAYMAADQGNFIDCEHEYVRDELTPTIAAATEGALS